MNEQKNDTKTKWLSFRIDKLQPRRGDAQQPTKKWFDAPTMGYIPKRCICCGGYVNHDE